MLAVACGVGALFGIIGVVLGIIGMNKAKQLGGKGRGMSLAGLVLSAVGIVLSIVLYIVLFAVADNASDSIKNWTGKANPADYSLKIETCEIDEMGYPHMAGTISNKTSSEKNYTFDYEFRDGQGSLVDSGTSFPNTIPKGDSTLWDINSFKATKAKTVKCEIIQVKNWFN